MDWSKLSPDLQLHPISIRLQFSTGFFIVYINSQDVSEAEMGLAIIEE